jgi:flagellar basal body-associated protein FliL
MSDTPATPPALPGSAKPAKTSPLALILPAILAGAAAFGGARAAVAHAAAPTDHAAEHAEKPPGPTVTLEPFLVTIPDGVKKSHPMKVTLAVEFDPATKEEALKAFIPRIRDASLSYMRGLTYEQAADPKTEQMRVDFLNRIHAAGAGTATQVLITDLVVQ